MDQTTLISVIVPVYNVEEYLPRCVDSILAQTYRNLEVILVDDGTKDASDQICDEYAAKDPRIKVIHKENGGLSSARNAGINVARGEYFGFVDSDDWIEPEMYEQMLDLAKKHNVKLVCAGRYDFSSRRNEKTVGLCPEKEEVITGMELLGRTFTWDGCDSAAWDKLYHRDLFEEIRYPVGLVNEDVAIFYKIAEQVDRAAMCDKPLYNYYHRPGSITYSKLSEKSFHLIKHTAVIYPYIRENHPELTDQARYQRVRSLMSTVQSIDLAGEEAQKSYGDCYRECRKELAGHLGFVLKYARFTKKQRRDAVVLASGLYRQLRKLRHGGK